MAAPPPSDASTPVRAFHDLVRLPIGGGAELAYAPLARTAHRLGPVAVRALLSCRGFATLDEHASRAAATGLPRAAVRAELDALVAGGLLVTEAALVAALAASANGVGGGAISTLVVPTRDRPGSLCQTVAGFAENARAHGRSLRILVVDQGADDAAERRLAGIEVRGVALALATAADVDAFAARLVARGGFDPELVAFALGPPAIGPDGVGRSRNAALLAAAGETIAMVDDDVRCSLAPAPGAIADLALTSAPEPSEHWFPASSSPPADPDADPWALHETLLGRSPGDAARGLEVDLSRASGMFFRRLAPNGGRVRATHLGMRGDAATGSMAHLLTLAGPSRDRLLVSESVYRAAFATREVVRAATRPTIGDGPFCMSLALGLDARELLPPFLPVLRNGDGVFGLVLRVAWHDAYLGFLPWTALHAPPPRGGSFEDRFATIGHLGAADVLGQLVLASRVEADARDPAASLRAVGEALARWGALPLADFEEIARIHVLRARSRDIALHHDLLSAYGGAPAFWARDVEHTIGVLEAGATRPDLAWPVDLCAALGADAAREAMRRLTACFGALLRAWPDLWAAAVDLRREGAAFGRALAPCP